MHIIPQEDIKKVKWKGDHIRFDCALHALDRGKHDQFLVITPDKDYHNHYHFIDDFNYATEKRCVVWMYDGFWIAKLFPKNWEAGSYAAVEIELPIIKWKRNPKIPKSVKFENDPLLTFEPASWDTKYELIWYTTTKDKNNNEIWALKCYSENKKSQGTKHMGYLDIDPPELVWERNPNIPESIAFENDPTINYKIDIWNDDHKYELIWYVDSKFVNDEVWAFRCHEKNKKSKGVKNMGEVTPVLTKFNINDRAFQLDVIFISYYESNAEENWQRVLEKAPWAQRVDGVEGIFNAHKAASKLATTDMFYVVDGDAWLVDDFNFNFQPNIFDRDCTHIWRAQNPINDLVYGYGGVKLFSRQVVDDATNWITLDMSTTIGSKLKIVNKISNITSFNTDEYSTWRSAFRECVKLCYNIHQSPSNEETQLRLNAWLAPSDQPFAQYAIDAAHKSKEWVQQNINDIDVLRQINDRKWLEQEFKKVYNV